MWLKLLLTLALMAAIAWLVRRKLMRKKGKPRARAADRGRDYVLSTELPSGMQYSDDFISEEEAKELLDCLDAGDGSLWDAGDVKRRTQQFGFVFDFHARGQQSDHLRGAEAGAGGGAGVRAGESKEAFCKDKEYRPFPPPVERLARRLVQRGVYKRLPEQCIVNEYTLSQGIAAHVDRLCFGETVAGVSLIAACAYNMLETKASPAVKAGGRPRRYEGLLRPRSLWVLRGESRYTWQHEITPGARYRFADGTEFVRKHPYRRVSLTFRELPEDGAAPATAADGTSATAGPKLKA